MRLVIALILIGSNAFAQTIKRAEYYFDADPGKGNGTSISVTQGAAINETHTISVASLGNGPHTLGMRVLDSNGIWSQSSTRTFFIVTPVVTLDATVIKRAEYFFDADPGLGAGHALSISPSGTQSNSFVIDISALSSGFHQLCIRYQDDLFRWSLFAQRTFYMVPTVNLSPVTSIKKAEYFFDTDPGTGNGTPLSLSSSGLQNNFFAININSLATGFHQLAIRYQDDKGHWSLFTHRTFYIVPSANLTPASSIKKAEYFFDSDPGAGNGKSLSLTPNGNPNNTFALDVSALAKGFHQLMIRYQDDRGRWSTFSQRTFYILPGSILSTTLQKIEYYIDTDPGVDNGTPLSFPAASSVNQVFNIDLGATPPGNHLLFIRTKDSNGYWSYPISSAAFSISNCTVPSAPVGTDGSRCDPGSVTLSASGASGGQQYRWYVDGTTNTIAFNGPSYSTPSLIASTDYYTSVYDPATGCESSRTKISAAVTTIPKPMLSPSGSLTLCQGNSVTIAAPVGYTTYSWSTAATTQSITTSASASYTVRVSDGTCLSPPSDPLVLTVAARPAKPIVQALSTTIVCGSGSVALSAPIGASSYLWSDGQTTQQITASSSTSYTVQITDANNCQSASSDPISVQILPTPNKPVVQVFGSTVLCKNGSSVLAAPAGFSKYIWSNGDTTAQIAVSSAGNYSVKVGNSLCMSVPSDVVSVTLANQLIKPIVQASGPTTICGNGSVTLSAPVGASSYLWSDGQTTQQITASSTANYTVQITDTNNCQSVSSDPIAVQVLPMPNKPIITPLSSTVLCKNATVILSAPLGFSKYRWSNGDTTAQTIIGAAGNYTVKVGNAICMSAVSNSTGITFAAAQPKPIIQVTSGSLSICGSGSVTLKAPSASGYLWSDGSTGQTISLSNPGKYSVVVTDANNCQSDPSDQAVVQVVAIPAAPVVTPYGAMALCNGSTVILSAPSGFLKYKWSSGDTTAQVLTSSSGNYSVQVGYASNCFSPSSPLVSVTHTNQPCSGVPSASDIPPSIANATIAVPVGTAVSFGLKKLIKKADHGAGVNLSTLRIAFPVTNGTDVLITAGDSLWINYRGTSYVGIDSVGIQVCDSLGSCTERTLTVNVVAQIEVFNAVSPYPDGLNDFFNLKFIDKIDETKKNKVTIVDRWGNEVFSAADYNNIDRVFRGNDNSGKELPSGTYYYRIDFESGRPTLSGFLSLKR